MPISVSCPACSADFNVKDEYAGKRGKCPKCGEPVVVPSPFHGGDTVKLPPKRATAKPIAPIPKPQSVEANEPVADTEDAPKPKKKPRVDDDDEDTPRPKTKRRIDDDDDDRPAKKKARADDDPPKKKGGGALLIVGIIAGVLLLVCGGGAAAAYFFVIKPGLDAAERLKNELLATTSAPAPPPTVPVVPATKPAQPPATKPADPKPPADKTPVATLSVPDLADKFETYKDKYVTLKGQFKTMTVGEARSVVLVPAGALSVVVHPPIGDKFAFKETPQPLDEMTFTGKLTGNAGRLMVLSDSALVSHQPNSDQATALTADELTTEFDKDADAANKKYDGKLLRVTGPVNGGGNVGNRLGLKGVQVKPPGGGKTKAYFLDCLFEGEAREVAKGVKLGETATIVGVFGGIKRSGVNESWVITLNNCKVAK